VQQLLQYLFTLVLMGAIQCVRFCELLFNITPHDMK